VEALALALSFVAGYLERAVSRTADTGNRSETLIENKNDTERERERERERIRAPQLTGKRTRADTHKRIEQIHRALIEERTIIEMADKSRPFAIQQLVKQVSLNNRRGVN